MHSAVRQDFYKLVKERSCTVHVVSCQLNEDVLRQRLMVREEARDDASEANIFVMEQQLDAEEPLTKNEQKNTYFIDMQDGADALGCVLKELRKAM